MSECVCVRVYLCVCVRAWVTSMVRACWCSEYPRVPHPAGLSGAALAAMAGLPAYRPTVPSRGVVGYNGTLASWRHSRVLEGVLDGVRKIGFVCCW